MAKRNHWVVRKGNKWVHKKEKASRASGIYDDQRKAWDAARKAAKKDKTEAILKGRNGKVRKKHSYGKDPYPPKG